MRNILSKILGKRGINNVNELSPEEKQTFDNWEKILSKEELSIEDIKQFCKTQIGLIEGKWSDLNIEQGKKSELIPYHTVYRTILQAIDSPKVVREALERQLNELIK